MKNWKHIIVDIYDINLENFCKTKDDLQKIKKAISEEIKNNSLTEIWNIYHFFWENAATATICLSESHLNFHTWPEKKYVFWAKPCVFSTSIKPS